MKIEIFDAIYAAKWHRPKEPSIMIRLFSSKSYLEDCMHYSFEKVYPDLDYERDYLKVLKYEFDDYDLEEWEDIDEIKKDPLLKKIILFDEEKAKKIIKDFSECRKDASSLIVHCLMGERRSPAVGMALNEIFELGAEIDEMKYPRFNRYVYRTMLRLAKKESF